MSSPASPSGNRHDGVRVYSDGGSIGYGDPPGRGATGDDHMRYRMYPVDIDAARTAVIAEVPGMLEAILGMDAQIQSEWGISTDPPDVAWDAWIARIRANLDALTTKGATT